MQPDLAPPPPATSIRHVKRGPDRRKQPTPRFSRYTFFGGRRSVIRRPEELEGSYVDRYHVVVALVLGWVALMNIGDSFFTLWHLQSGGVELNPVAEALLRTGRLGFVFWKSLLIAVAMLVLVLHKNFWLARVGMWVAAAGYTALNVYHLSLF